MARLGSSLTVIRLRSSPVRPWFRSLPTIRPFGRSCRRSLHSRLRHVRCRITLRIPRTLRIRRSFFVDSYLILCWVFRFCLFLYTIIYLFTKNLCLFIKKDIISAIKSIDNQSQILKFVNRL